MSSTYTERDDNILWENGDSLCDGSVRSPLFSKQANTSSQITTPGLNSPMASFTLSSQYTTIFFPTSSSLVPGSRPSRKSKFHGNRDTDKEGLSPSLEESSGSLILPTRKQNGSNLLDHAVDTLPGIQHPFLIGSRT